MKVVLQVLLLPILLDLLAFLNSGTTINVVLNNTTLLAGVVHMAFIKAQKLVYNDDGSIKSGSAAIVDVTYQDKEHRTGAYHSKQVVRERLGRVLYLSEDKKYGIFLSPTRGLVSYDVTKDEFAAVEQNDSLIDREKWCASPEIHTVFGDAYLLLTFMKNTGMTRILRSVFPKDEEYERVLAHILHGILRDGSHIGCDDFIEKSFASYVLDDVAPATLRSDTRFYSLLGDDRIRVAFFKAFVKEMRKQDASFGKGCYIDSTPLPNDITGNPFNALSCHGITSCSTQIRLALVLDEKTGFPVWFDIIPGNVIDLNTTLTLMADIADTLDIVIDSLVLDAGYVSQELIKLIHKGTEKTMIARMPAKKGYPFKTLYWRVKDEIFRGKYEFLLRGHMYFGKQIPQKIFEYDEYCYVYVDKENALQHLRDYIEEHADEYYAMSDKDKDWYNVKFGYFILLSNRDETPKQILTEYFEREDIEGVFKTSKEYLRLLPLSKWTDLTVRGKILQDTIDTIIDLQMRGQILPSGLSCSRVIGKIQSLMCHLAKGGKIYVEQPSKQVKEYYNLFKIKIPNEVDVSDFKSSLLKLDKSV